MALLGKVRSATLIEALVATVLIVIVFIIASLVLNNLLLNSFANNIHAVENRMHELEYQYNNNSIRIPYREEFGSWNIELKTELSYGQTWITGTATNKGNKKEVIKSRVCNTPK